MLGYGRCPKGYVLTDEGGINKFLGIEIKEITKNRFELSQPFLIEQIVNPLGLGHIEFGVHTNTRIAPVGKPLLDKDLKGNLYKKDWNHGTAISMLTYLQGNTRPEISTATHQLAQFLSRSIFVKIQDLVMNKQPHVLTDVLHTLKTQALSIILINLWA